MIRIRDNGIGCKDIHKGFGLTHMKERVDMLHGTVTYSSNNGFQIVAKLQFDGGMRKDDKGTYCR